MGNSLKISLIIIVLFLTSNILSQIPRYIKIPLFGNGYIWEWTNQPYIVVEEMCWNRNEGFDCDERFHNTFDWEYIVVDFEQKIIGSIYINNENCYIFWWLEEYGEDNNPHVKEAFWIECN